MAAADQSRRCRHGDRGKGIIGKAEHALMPVAAMAFKLADRQRIKKFIGDDQQGFFRQVSDLLMPVGAGIGAAGKLFLLGGDQCRVDLNKVEIPAMFRRNTRITAQGSFINVPRPGPSSTSAASAATPCLMASS